MRAFRNIVALLSVKVWTQHDVLLDHNAAYFVNLLFTPLLIGC